MLECLTCKKQFEFSEDPINAFVGYLLNVQEKAMEPEVTLCLECYHKSILSSPATYKAIRPNLYNYPMKWRAKYIPDGPNM